MGDGGGGGAAVEADHAARPHQVHGACSDQLLLLRVAGGPVAHRQGAGVGVGGGAAVAADHQLLIGQCVQVAAHRGRGDAELGDQVLYAHVAVVDDQVEHQVEAAPAAADTRSAGGLHAPCLPIRCAGGGRGPSGGTPAPARLGFDRVRHPLPS